MFKALTIAAVVVCLTATAPTLAQTPVKIGILTDMGGPFSDLAGPGSVAAARLAVEDAGGTVLGRPIEILTGDHQGKPDIAVNIARRWYDTEGVTAIADVTLSGVALAVQEVARQRKAVVLFSGATSSDLLGKTCGPTSFQWTFNTASSARTTTAALVGEGAKTWFFISADYAFGRAMTRDASAIVTESGGKILGTVWHPTGTSDFASYLLQAQGSGAQVVALVSGGADFINVVKQANEFGLAAAGQKIVSMQTYMADVHGLGLPVAQNLTLAASFYWDLNDKTRAWSARFGKLRAGNMPDMVHAGVYSAVRHYIKAIEKAGSTDGLAVSNAMRSFPVDDMMTSNARIRDDGWVMRDLYLFRVKTPAESKAPWDYYKLIATIPAEKAAPPRLSECKTGE